MAQVETNTQNPNDPNNPNAPANQPANQQINQPATSGGAGAVTSTGAANVTGQVVGTNNPTQPFQNIASYLSANAPQSANLANEVAGTVTQPIAQTTNDITNASQDFTNSVNAGYTPQNTTLISQVAANPTAAAANPNTVTSFQQQLNDAYTGPTDFTAAPAYTNLNAEIANAQALGQSALTPTGIQTLLQSTEAQDYTQGINNLDALLLNENPQNLQTIQNAGLVANTANNALQNFLTTQTTQDAADVQAAEANAAAAQTAAQQGLTGAENAFTGNVNQEVANAQQAATAYNQPIIDLQKALATGDFSVLTPADNAVLAGGTNFAPGFGNVMNAYQAAAAGLPGFNLPLQPNFSNAATIPNEATIPTVGNVATPADYAEAQAFNTLAGMPQNLPIDPAMAASAGQFGIPATNPTFNTQSAALDLINLLNATGIENIPAGTQSIGTAPYNQAMSVIGQWLNQNFPGTPTTGGNPSPLPGGGAGGGGAPSGGGGVTA